MGKALCFYYGNLVTLERPRPSEIRQPSTCPGHGDTKEDPRLSAGILSASLGCKLGGGHLDPR